MKNFNFKFYFFRFKNVLAVLFVSFLINSCKKDSNIAGNDPNAVNPVSLEIQKWLIDQKFDSVKVISINNLKAKVQWSMAHSITGDSSLSYDIAPITLDTVPKFDDVSLTLTKYLVLTKANGIINNSAIIDLFGNKKTLINDFDKLIASYYKKRQDSFTGIVTINNIFGSVQESKEYSLGLIKFWKTLRGRGKSNGKTILSTDKKISFSCIDWYWCTYDYYGNETSSQYLYTTCDGPGDSCAQKSIIDHKGVQSIGSLCNGSGSGGGGDGSNTTTQQDIINNLTNPCLNNALTKLLANNVNNDINDIIQSTFNVSDRINIQFSEAQLGAGTLYGNSGIVFDSRSFYTSTITLNDDVLVGSSQELIASTMIHEVLHSYFDYNQVYYTNSLGQHLEMATNFVDKMRISLQKSFPNLVDKDANALIINGFSEIQSNLPANFQQILDKYNLTINDVGTIRDSYKKNGTAGNRCN